MLWLELLPDMKQSPGTGAGTSFIIQDYWSGLRGAALPVQIFVVLFILPLTALFLLPGLPVLLTALASLAVLAVLSGLVLLSRLFALLTSLSTLLSVFFHIVCHEIVLLLKRATWRVLEFKCYFLVAAEAAWGWRPK
jgi:hypothetical protein